MTTPNTPAGWYSDPDGSGGQRFWDGTQWTEHRSPAPDPTPQPPSPPPASGGKHAASPTEPDPVEPTPVEPETVETAATPPVYSVPTLPPPSFDAPSQDAPSYDRPTFDAPSFDAPTSSFETASFNTPSFDAPAFDAPPAPPAEPKDARSKLIMQYSIGVGIGLAAVIATVLYAVFNDNGASTIAFNTPTSTTTSTTATTTTTTTTTTAPASETPIPTGGPGDASNADMTFVVTALDSATTVTSPTDATQTEDATGQFIIVSMDVTNTGAQPATYSAGLQKLIVGGTPYDADPQASSYLGATDQDLAPGDQIHAVIVFDVPSDSVPDAIELHGDATSPGFTLPFQ
jgi:Domain of unknown function (DUF4352)/Protein of unknown function (DUF2510)